MCLLSAAYLQGKEVERLNGVYKKLLKDTGVQLVGNAHVTCLTPIACLRWFNEDEPCWAKFAQTNGFVCRGPWHTT